ncbi:hypothetical protein [Gephyromycinifex aptenodytis]|uniref:hypothetical protein n=1 Tax=Gephyromycinifex aptenodytis TaxID=2716227 RepID=UPI00144723B7|nr:hypothetical protein [Gephyromycinifex aptenodytis]
MAYDTRTPHLDPHWVDEFVLELRLRDVPGTSIGAALAEAELHCADSGQGARDAFGDPAEYARSLSLPASPLSMGALTKPLLAGVVGVLGTLLTADAFAAWRGGEALRITWGMLALLTLNVAVVAVLLFTLNRALEFVLRHPVRFGLVMAVHVAASVGVLLLFPSVAATAPAAGALLVGVLLLALSIPLQAAAAQLNDPVVGPGEAAGIGSDPDPSPRWMRLANLALFPALTLALIGLDFVLSALQ